MKKTYIKPMNIIESADLMDDVMISGSQGGNEIFTDGGSTSGQVIESDSRDAIPSDNLWDDAW